MLKYDDDGNLVSVNLDLKNPSSKQDLEHVPPEQLVESILGKKMKMAIVAEIKATLASGASYNP